MLAGYSVTAHKEGLGGGGGGLNSLSPTPPPFLQK